MHPHPPDIAVPYATVIVYSLLNIQRSSVESRSHAVTSWVQTLSVESVGQAMQGMDA